MNSFENNEAYPHNLTGPKRHRSGKICGFSKGPGTEFLPRRPNDGAWRRLETDKCIKLNRLPFSANSKPNTLKILAKNGTMTGLQPYLSSGSRLKKRQFILTVILSGAKNLVFSNLYPLRCPQGDGKRMF